MAESDEERLGPSACKRRLRQELRRARESAGLTQEQAAHALDWHLSKVLRIEAGTSGVAVTDLQAMLRLYDAYDPATFETLARWARGAKERVWWSAYKPVVPRNYYYFLGLESEASRVLFFQDRHIPGLLQHPDYNQAIMSGRPDDAVVELRIELRTRRQQEAFGRPRPLEITAVLDEAALRRTIGGAAVMKSQLHHLLAISERPHIHLHVLPFAVASRPFLGGAFTVVEFDTDDAVVYVESGVAEDTMERRQDVAAHQKAFADLLRTAANAEDSRRLVADIADTF